jgi:hypothetical protein
LALRRKNIIREAVRVVNWIHFIGSKARQLELMLTKLLIVGLEGQLAV